MKRNPDIYFGAIFLKYRFENPMNSCCIDSDWGVGVISKNYQIGTKINSKKVSKCV